MAYIDKDSIVSGYEDVRNDDSEINWAFVIYNEEDEIVLDSTGVDYKEMLEKFQDDQRAFVFVRIMVTDEMRVRPKFVMITWIGQNVEPMRRAKVSTDKARVRQIFQNCSKELQTSDLSDLEEDYLKQELIRTTGASQETEDHQEEDDQEVATPDE